MSEVHNTPHTDRTPADWSNEAWRGFVDILPLLLAAMPFGMLYGTLAVQNGLSPLEAVMMSVFVFAGGAQFIAVDMWTTPTPVIAIVAATFLVNARHILMGAALAPHLAHLPGVVRNGFVAIHADESWATAIKRSDRRKAAGGLTVPYILGMAVPFYLNWPLSGGIGAIFGGLVQDPARYGADFVFTAAFICLVAGLWRGKASLPPVAASAIAALGGYLWLDGVWYVFLGAVAGTVAGALGYRPERHVESGR